MRVLPPVEEEIRRIVRDERAKDPLASVSKLEAALEKHFQRGFSHQYVSKIADKVAREGLIQADRTQIEERMNFSVFLHEQEHRWTQLPKASFSRIDVMKRQCPLRQNRPSRGTKMIDRFCLPRATALQLVLQAASVQTYSAI